MKLDTILDGLIEYGRTMADEKQSAKKIMGDVIFAKQFATVAVNPGRQTGKTMSIARRAQANDIVFSYNTHAKDEMLRRLQFWNKTFMPECKAAGTSDIDTEREYTTVWIDEASYLKPGQLDAIYEALAGKAKYFVLVG
jgi:hypothetical protein